MANGNPLLDDMAKAMTGMVGAAQAVGEEARTVARGQAQRFIEDMDLASREEIEILKGIAQSALTRVEELEARVSALEGKETKAD